MNKEIDEAEIDRVIKETADEIIQNRIEPPGRGVGWTTPVYFEGDFILNSPCGIYKGSMGIAIFLAAYHSRYGDERARKLLDKTLNPLMNPEKAFRYHTSSFADGIPGFIYALIILSDILDNDTYIEAAEGYTSRIDEDGLREDDSFDILSGNAGVVLPLVELYERRPNQDILDKAVISGEHLLSESITDDPGITWNTGLSNKPLTGFSHGTTGISYSLLKLYLSTGEDRFLEAAEKGLRWEDSQYNENEKNWPDRREDRDYMDAWCHGRTGVLFAQIRMSQMIDGFDEYFRIDAIKEISTQLDTQDCLCHGNAGRTMLLLNAFRYLGDSELEEKMHQLVLKMVARRNEKERFRYIADLNDTFYSPSLFLGSAGTAYSLLRVLDPEQFPSLLTID